MNEQNKKSKQNSDDETNKPDIQPSEPTGDAPDTENQQSGDPGRTPGKAEGSREIIEEDLDQKDK